MVAGAVVPEPAEVVPVRLGVGKLLITLLAVLPQPAARQARTRMAADRERLFAGCTHADPFRVVPRTRAPP